ncbi:uncharacterized protein [Antedon mediterranea]|uniref:uncharacterized protein n=1 Tax=Antedon mediterranea TaxID=105859 RepID=UPI003AF7EAAF
MENPFREKRTKCSGSTNQMRELSAVGKYRLTKMKQRQMMRYFSLKHPENRSRNVSSCSSSSASSSICDSQERLSFEQTELVDDTFLTDRESKQITDRKATLSGEGKFFIKSRRKDLNRLKSDSDVVTHRKNIVYEDMVRSKAYIMASETQKIQECDTTKPETRCLMPHPTKKMLRTRSESAIELNTARNRLSNQHGVVCTNEDLKKILTEARSIGSVRRRRTTSGHNMLAVTPESIEEIDGHVRSRSVSMITSLKSRRTGDVLHEYQQGCRSSPSSFEALNSLNTPISRTNSAKEIRSIKEIDEDIPSCSKDCIDNNENELSVSNQNIESDLADTLATFNIDVDTGIDPEAIGKAIERRLTIGSKQANKYVKRGGHQTTNVNFQKNQMSNKSKDGCTQVSEKGFANRITSLTSKFKRSKSTTDCVKL